ncbi:hypothetical protein D9619_006909 [Psilocybe cf. subviscida]|uniref:Uncharacterized protein n=1 Tax=Psilocybe cf. subviscida TaxID=2480587 RepID=A0A8H5B3J9_9AGAR|nr:hypothetical protein D9619_006909 [Psilocybe cf. subviscida]
MHSSVPPMPRSVTSIMLDYDDLSSMRGSSPLSELLDDDEDDELEGLGFFLLVETNNVAELRIRNPGQPPFLYPPRLPHPSYLAYLGRFSLFCSHQIAPIKQLSDRPRNCVVFAQLAMEHLCILLLDKPTNHLDMESIDTLAKAIGEFEGGVITVSYDFCLILQVAQDLWEVANKTIISLTKRDINIVNYKKNLAKQSMAATEKGSCFSKMALKKTAVAVYCRRRRCWINKALKDILVTGFKYLDGQFIAS